MGNQKTREFMKRRDKESAWERLQSIPRDLTDDVCFPSIEFRRLQVAILPSFDPGYSWDIRELNTLKLFRSEVVVEIGERPRLRGYTELQASADELRDFLDRICSISLPIAPPADGMVGLDGTTYHVALGSDGLLESRFSWWQEPPPNWRPLGSIVSEMITRFIKLSATQ